MGCIQIQDDRFAVTTNFLKKVRDNLGIAV